MFWQLSLTPKPADPQAQQQQKTMMFIPFVFVFFFYNFAAALSLYYTAQNILSIIQLYATRHRPLPVLQKVDPTKLAAKAKRGGGGFGRFLEQMQAANAAKGRDANGGGTPGGNGRNGGGSNGSGATRARRPRA